MAKVKAAEPGQAPKRKVTVKTHLGKFIDARHGIVAVTTDDEPRLLKVEIQAMTNGSAPAVFRWDATTKIVERKTGREGTFSNIRSLLTWFFKEPPEMSDDSTANGEINENNPAPKGSVLIVLDAMYYLQATSTDKKHSTPVITREIKNGIPLLISQRKTVFLVGHGEPYIPPELKRMIPSFAYPMPDLNYLYAVVSRMAKCFASEEDRKVNAGAGLVMSMEQTDDIARRLLGMTEAEAESVLKKAILENVRKRGAAPETPMGFDSDVIEAARAEMGEKNDGLKIVMPKPKKEGELSGTQLIGGSHKLCDWFLETVFPKIGVDAQDEHFDMPKGAVIFGPGGVGKDNTVEHLGHEIGWPIIYADLGAAKASYQGESHRNFRQILEYAEHMAPCFLVLSEFEKMFSGAMTPGASACDGGTGQEILATWLNWTQSRTSPVFVWGLTNDLSGLSQPSLRAGRWDMVWFMDLPPVADRAEIFAVHLNRTHWGAENFRLDELAEKTHGYTGAEIRKVVDEAISIKYRRDGSKRNGHFLKQEHLLEAINLVPSTLKTRKLDVESLRKFAKEGGYPVANPEVIAQNQKEETSLSDEVTKIITQ